MRNISIPEWGIDLTLMVCVGAFFGFLGPFSTEESPLLLRMGYWITVMSIGGFVIRGAEWVSHRILGRKSVPIVVSWITTTVIATIPQTFVVAFSERQFFGDYGPLLIVFTYLIIPVFVVILAMVPLMHMARTFIKRQASPQESSEGDMHSDSTLPEMLASKLPANLRSSQLIALQAEDHYVRVHTVDGSDLILMRFSDAVTALAPGAGHQLHRSWWVANGAIEQARYSKGRGEARLKGGVIASISRTYAPALRKAGVI